MKFSIKGFFRKYEQICAKLEIWSHLLKKSLMQNFSFCAVVLYQRCLRDFVKHPQWRFFQKKLHHRCFVGFSKHLWVQFIFYTSSVNVKMSFLFSLLFSKYFFLWYKNYNFEIRNITFFCILCENHLHFMRPFIWQFLVYLYISLHSNGYQNN